MRGTSTDATTRRRRIVWSSSFLVVFSVHVLAVIGLPDRIPLSAPAPIPVVVVAFTPVPVEPVPEPEPEIKAVEIPKVEPIVQKRVERPKKKGKRKQVEGRPDPIPQPREEIVAATRPVAAPPATSGQGDVPPDYQALLSSWLEKHKQYPRRARLRRQEGVVQLSFTLDRTGRVISYNIARSSGYSLLDEEVESLIQRAQPMPPFPPDMREASLKLTVPISFRLL